MASGTQTTVTVVFLAIICFIGVKTINSSPFFASTKMDALDASSTIVSKSTLAADNRDTCKEVLDAMDKRFDFQRDTRIKKKTPVSNHMLFFDAFEPESVCFTEERFGGKDRYGSFGDGPKFVCGVDFINSKDCLVYNIGSNNQIDFEQAVSKTVGCEIHTFDPTLTAAYKGDKYSAFHPWGLGKEGDTITVKDKTFKTRSVIGIVKELNHTSRKIDIFKIDCEGCEYTVMPLVFQAVVNGTIEIDQIQIELHVVNNSNQVIPNLFNEADRAGFRIFHKERNHWGCQGYKCVEYSFAHKSFLRKVNEEVACGHQYSKVAASSRRLRKRF